MSTLFKYFQLINIVLSASKYTFTFFKCATNTVKHTSWVAWVFFSSSSGETVKIELIQLIPPGTTDIIPLVLLNYSCCRLKILLLALEIPFCSWSNTGQFWRRCSKFSFPRTKACPIFLRSRERGINDTASHFSCKCVLIYLTH